MQSNSFLARYKVYHILFWVLVYAAWYYLRYQDYATTAMAVNVTLLKVIDLALMVYITNYVLLPKLLYKKKYGWFGLAFVMMILCSSIVKLFLLGQILHRPDLLDLSSPGLKERIYDNVIPHFFLVIAGAAVKLMLDNNRAQRRLGEMAKEKAEAELNFLKSQINPHFLFNSLNSVYFLIDRNNTGAREALHKFSDMLRYQLYEMNGDLIPVEKEIDYLKDYVDLQKLRKDENYAVEFTCSPEVKNFSIEPLLLIPFVENAFKHLSHHKDKLNYVKLNLGRSNGEFSFEIENSKENSEPNPGEHGGIGLANVKRRLELLYPGKHSFKISNHDSFYKINLKLKI
ncbi:MAG TPA: histidine kinase [Chitinophagaceae bacterium]|nr:histidine kinase [Chitinophagaceae bacterium]